MDAPTKILLVDDQSLYREGMIELFKRWPELEVVGDAENGEDAIEMVGEHLPDIVLMDVKMPVMDGIEACGVIRSLYPQTKVVMLSLYGDKERVLSAISNGANGYLLKNIHAKQLHYKLSFVAAGGGALPDEIAGLCLDVLRRPSLVPVDEAETQRILQTLTDHEKELLRLLALGTSNKDIGVRLFIGESTVKKQISSILVKLQVDNRVQAAVFALRSGIA